MSGVLDSIHDGQLFLGKQPFTTSKKITVLSLSGSLSNDEFLLYHVKGDENDGYFVPFETSKKVEVKTHKNMKKILFETKEEDGMYRLYLNQELVYIHTGYKEKLYLNTHYSPILQDGTLYEFDEKYSIDYNKKNNLKLEPIPIQYQEEEEVHQETSQEEVQDEETLQEEEEVQGEETLQEEEEVQGEETLQEEEEVKIEETLQEEVQIEETSQEEEVQVEDTLQVEEPSQEEEVQIEETLQEEVKVEEPSQEEEVQIEETLQEEVHVKEPSQEEEVQVEDKEPSQEEEVQVEEIQMETTQVEEVKMEESEIQEMENVIEENQIICDVPSDKTDKNERIKDVVDTINEIEQEKKEIDEIRTKKKDEAFLQIIQDFNQFQLKKEKERSEEEKENIEKRMFQAQQKNNIIQHIEFNHMNRVYKLPCIKAQSSNELNFHNILMNQIPPSNLVIRKNIAIHVPENNQYYLINYLNTKYLFYRMNGMLIVTNIHTKNSKIVKNKEMIKLMNNDYLLTYNSSILVPMEQKKYFDNHYGTTFQTFMPRL